MEKTKRAAFKLIGLNLGKKTTNEGGQSAIDCGNLWQKFEKEGVAQKIPNKISESVYAVYFDYEGDQTQPFSYFIGCPVNMDTEATPDMDSLLIPADNYSKLMARGAMPDCISKCWKDIWNTKTGRAYNHDFEVYDERSKDWSNAEVEIFVSSRH